MLKWTKKSPVKTGWYWKRDHRKESCIVYVRNYSGTMCIMNWPIPTDLVEWAGPIEEPK